MTSMRDHRDALSKLRLELYERALKRVFRERSAFWESEMARLFSGACARPADEWQEIGSLAALRKICGGRFEVLKRLWTGAGFPLRRHRGDRSVVARIDDDGWRVLSDWLSEKGLEARRSPATAEHLMEIRDRRKS